MENDILDSLQDIGYTGHLLAEPELTKALDGGPKCPEYTKLVHIICDELKTLCGTEESVNCTQDADDASSFLLELSSFLKEIGCPYKAMVTGHMSSRLQTRGDRILLLDYLLSELMAARMVNVNEPKNDKQMEIVVHETPTAKDLKDILLELKFNKPPPNITPEVLFTKVLAKLNETIAKKGEELLGKPLYNKALNEKQWRELEVTYNEMFEEYQLRRETLITRLHCTIQSFEWSDRVKDKRDTVQSVYAPLRAKLSTKPAVKLSDFLAARDSLLLVEKTSSASVRKNTQSDVNKVIIGRVPDRGGRPSEQQAPPPEMPPWIKQRNEGGGGGGFGGRGGGGGFGGRGGGRGDSRGGRGDSRGGRGDSRGGRVQGGWQRTNENQNNTGGRNQGAYNNRDSNQNSGQSYNSQPSSNQYSGHQTYVTQSSQSYQSNSYQPQSKGYQTQSQSYQGPSQGYQAPSQSYQAPSQSYQAPSPGYMTQSKGYQTQSYQSPSQSYQTPNQGYQSRRSYDSNSSSSGYATQDPGYTTQDSGYATQDRYSNSGRSSGYQNEHDDRMSGGRSNSDYSGQRGRSNYNRGGRY